MEGKGNIRSEIATWLSESSLYTNIKRFSLVSHLQLVLSVLVSFVDKFSV